MPFMEHQITVKQTWLKIDGTNGITYVPVEVLAHNRAAMSLFSEEQQLETAACYYDGTPESVQFIKGFGARTSAPGYLDCTEWSVFGTADEAQAYLDEYYPEDDDEDSCDDDEVEVN